MSRYTHPQLVSDIGFDPVASDSTVMATGDGGSGPTFEQSVAGPPRVILLCLGNNGWRPTVVRFTTRSLLVLYLLEVPLILLCLQLAGQEENITLIFYKTQTRVLGWQQY